MAGIDPTKVGKYPVILSDAILGSKSKELYAGVRYNHRPTLSSDAAPSFARLKPTTSKKGSYDLSFLDEGGKYTFQGARATEDGQYVLIFDPSRQAFVLHRVDSLFNMNLVRTPANNDAESLKHEFPHLPGGSSIHVSPPSTSTARPAKERAGKDGAARPSKADRPAAPAMSLPKKPTTPPTSSSKAKRRAAESDEDSDEDDDDGGLTLEFPGGASAPSRDFSPAFAPPVRRFSEFVKHADEEDEEDADGEDEDDDAIELFTLPSPINHQLNQSAKNALHIQAQEQDDDDDDDGMEDVVTRGADEMDVDENDLEAALEAELEEAGNSGSNQQMDSESDVSEED